MNIRELLTSWSFKVDHEPLEKVEHQLEGIKHRLEFLGAVEVLKSVYELTERFAHFAEELHVAATSAGLTVEEFQKLGAAAAQSAVSQDEMGMAMFRLSRHLYDARKGGAEAQKAFALAGINGAQVASFKTSRDALMALADQFKNIQDPIKKQALAQELLGRGSVSMVGFLSKGSSAIRGMGDEAEKLGLILSEHQVEALVSVEHSMIRFVAVLKNLGATIAVYLAPIINTAVALFTKFYAANKKIIEVNIKHWVEDLAYVLGFLHGLVQGIVEVFLQFAGTHQILMRRVFELFLALGVLTGGVLFVQRAIALLKGSFGLLQVAMGPIQFMWAKVFAPAITWIGALVGESLTSLFLSLATLTETALPAVSEAFLAIGASMEATPIGWIITGIAALVVVIHDLWTILTGGKWEDTWIAKGWGMIKGFASKAASFLGLGSEAPSPEGAAPQTEQQKTTAGFANALQNMGGVAGGLIPGAGPDSANGMAAAAAGAGGANVQISAPLTIQAAEGMNEKELAKYATDKHREHMDRTLREASRSLTPVLAQ